MKGGLRGWGRHCFSYLRPTNRALAADEKRQDFQSRSTPAAQIELADALVRMVKSVSWRIPKHGSLWARAGKTICSWYDDPIIAACCAESRTSRTP